MEVLNNNNTKINFKKNKYKFISIKGTDPSLDFSRGQQANSEVQ